MSDVDQRIVEMKFDRMQFGNGIKSTLDDLANLKNGLKLDGASKGLDDVSASAGRFSLAGMKDQLSGVLGGFTALQVTAITVLSNIVSKAVSAGAELVKSLSVSPIMDGFREYELKMGSIQTILANTQKDGTSLEQVTSALDELNHYADKTIYNFGDMTRNIGLFTNAGIGINDATTIIKGFSNAAAASGVSAEGASGAAYQLSQALSSGTVRLMDWRSLTNVGLGSENMREGIIGIAEAMGTFTGTGSTATSAAADFNGSLEDGWLSAEVMSTYLKIMSGDMDDASIAALGLSEAQVSTFRLQADTAYDAATKVRTFTQLMGTLKESVGSGWAATFDILFGDFNEATELFTGISDTLGGIVEGMATARNNMLQGWADLGGRTILIEALGNAFRGLMSFLAPIGQAFRQIFPAKTAEDLLRMTENFRSFTTYLQVGSETADNLKRTFAGVFALFDIGWQIIKRIASMFITLFATAGNGATGILGVTASIGDFLVQVDEAVANGSAFANFFENLTSVLQKAIQFIRTLGAGVFDFFSGLNLTGAGTSIGNIADTLQPLSSMGDFIAYTWGKVSATFDNIIELMGPLGTKVADFFNGFPALFGDAFNDLDYDGILAGLQTGLLAGLVLVIRNFFKNFELFGGIGGGVLDGIADSLDNLSGTLSAMQGTLKAATLLMIAAAILALAVAVTVLSHIDSEGLQRAMIALAAMFVQLGVAMAAFERIGTTGQAAKLVIMGAALILLSTAITILATAVEKLSGIPIEELRRGLIGVALLIGVLVAASNRLDTNTSGMIRTAAGLVILGYAIKVLVDSVQELSTLSWEELAKGLIGVGTLLAALTLFTRFADADKGGISQGVGLILLATALKILASAVGDFNQYNWEQLARGMAGIGVGLGLITAAMNLMPSGTIAKAAGIAVVAGALMLLAEALGMFVGFNWEEMARGMAGIGVGLALIVAALNLVPEGSLLRAASIFIVAASLEMIGDALEGFTSMNWEELARGLTALAASLGIIAIALNFMTGTLGGAAALYVVAQALGVLQPVLAAFGDMSWEELAKGFASLAAVFVILGVAGLLLAPITPVILALGIGIGLLGAAVFLAGAGVLLFATGLTALAAAGAGATAAIVAIVSGLIGLIPLVIEQIGLGLVAFAQVIITAGPIILEAITTVMLAFLGAIQETAPVVVETLLQMLTLMLNALIQAVPQLVDAGFQILIGFLNGIANNIGQVTNSAVNIILNFINALRGRFGDIIQAGIDAVISLMNGIGDGLRNNGAALADAGWNMASGLVEGLIDGLGSLVSNAVDAAINLASDVWDGAMDFLGINSPSKKFIYIGKWSAIGLAEGLNQYAPVAAEASAQAGSDVVAAMGKTISGLGDLINNDMLDLNPTIAPVLDLTAVKKDAASITSMLRPAPLEVSDSYSQARSASAGYNDNQDAQSAAEESRGGDTWNFNQTNNSPKALSSGEIYRKTKSLVARAKKRGDDSAD